MNGPHIFAVEEWKSRRDLNIHEGKLDIWFQFRVAGPPGNYPLAFDLVWPSGNSVRLPMRQLVEINQARVVLLDLKCAIDNATPGDYAIRIAIADTQLGDFPFTVEK